MLDDDRIDDLDPTRDKPAVYAWLRSYLRWHVGAWSEAAGLGWSERDIDAHIGDNDLVEREWNDLTEAAQDEQQLVIVARVGRRPIGILHARQREERYLRIQIGVLCWLFVEPVSRGTGVSALLMDASADWMTRRGLHAAELFVTADNIAAVKVYERSGYEIVDYRMFARLRS